jgi:hypothetical protein
MLAEGTKKPQVSAIAEACGCNEQTVRRVRCLFIRGTAEGKRRLDIVLSRKSFTKPQQVQPAVVQAILALSREPPPAAPEGGKPCGSPDAAAPVPQAHWTVVSLAEEAVRRGIVDRISGVTVSRILKEYRKRPAEERGPAEERVEAAAQSAAASYIADRALLASRLDALRRTPPPPRDAPKRRIPLRWSMERLAAEAVRRGWAAQLSAMTVCRLLREAAGLRKNAPGTAEQGTEGQGSSGSRALPKRRELQSCKYRPVLRSGERERLTAVADDPAEPDWKRFRAAVLLYSAVPMPQSCLPGYCCRPRPGPVAALSREQVAVYCHCSPATVTNIRRAYAEGGIEAVLTQNRGTWKRGANIRART